MKNQKKNLLLVALVLSLTATACGQGQAVPVIAEPEGPLVDQPTVPQVQPASSPEREDEQLFLRSLGTAQVPEAVKAQLQKGKIDNRNVRKFPYPYRAMLAIASDIDDTTPEEFAEYHRFLNTKEMTPNGQGVGLDVGDSMWMYMANDQPNITDKQGLGLDGVITWFAGTDTTKRHKADQIAHYFRAGWIDSMHTFGDFSRKNTKDVVFKREHAVKAWEELKKNNIKCDVWINHGNEANVDAFGAWHPERFSKYQAGDDPKSPAYHTDLSIKNGVRFVWNSIGEEKFGQDSPVFEIKLRDGQKVWGIHRYTHENGFDGKKDWTWVPREMHRQITKDRLNALVDKGQYSVVGQHLGGYNIGFPFAEKDVAALRLLADYQDQGKVLVARTSRLLRYAVAQKTVEYAVAEANGETWLNITAIRDPLFGPQPLTMEHLRGLTFYVKEPRKTHLLVNLVPVDGTDITLNQPDETKRPSISIKWYPRDVRDYSWKQ